MKRYFSHDIEAASDPKLSALLSQYSGMGYGLFWRIIEMLHGEETHMLPKKQYIYLTLAQQMGTSVEQIIEMINFFCEKCDLFKQDENYFWSERVFRNINQMKEVSEKRSRAGVLSGIARKNGSTSSTNTNKCSTNANKIEQNKIKENKINKNKENITHKTYVRSKNSRTLDFDPIHFDKFWNAYHPAGRVSRKKTIEIWKKQNLDIHIDEILRHLADLRKTHNWVNNQYIPHATTFLNQERWKQKVIEQRTTVPIMTNEQKRKEDFRNAILETYGDFGQCDPRFSIFSEEEYAEKIINSVD